MARFKFFLIGSSQTPVLDVDAADLRELNDIVSRNRFIEGHIAERDEDGVFGGMLIATGRIQLVMEAA